MMRNVGWVYHASISSYCSMVLSGEVRACGETDPILHGASRINKSTLMSSTWLLL